MNTDDKFPALTADDVSDDRLLAGEVRALTRRNMEVLARFDGLMAQQAEILVQLREGRAHQSDIEKHQHVQGRSIDVQGRTIERLDARVMALEEQLVALKSRAI